MPLKKIKRMFARIFETDSINKKRFKKIAFIIDNGEKYQYIIMKIPHDRDFIIPNRDEQYGIKVIEIHRMGTRYSKKNLKYRCQLLNRRRQREIKRKRDKRN